MAAMGLYCLLNCGTSGMGILLLGSIFVPVLATQAVFDFVGGIESMPGPRPSLATFLGGWLRGVLGHQGDFAGQFKPLPASEQASLKAHDSEWCGPVP